MNNLKDSNFGFFFTRGLSLKQWDKLGMLIREIRPYQELAGRFKRVYLFTYGTADGSYANLFSENVVIVERPRWIPTNLYSLLLPLIHARFFKTIALVKTNQMDGSWVAVLAKKIFGCKLVVRCGYEWLDFLRKAKRAWWKRACAYAVEKFAYRNADHIIITSVIDKNFIIRTFSIPSEKILVNPNYIDTNKFKPLPVEKVKGRILFLGRFEDQKNLFSLFEAVIGVDAHLVLIGSGSHQSALEVLAKKRGVHAIWLGNLSQDQLPIELNKSEIFILPSLYEGNPKALLEAMACGLPCIGTNVPGMCNVLTDEKNGIICEPDAASIHAALKKVLNDSVLQERISQNARQYIVETCSLDQVIAREQSVYQSLLSKIN